MKSLSSEAARADLSDRECAKIVGSVIGGLVQMAPIENVRDAVRWWAENDDAWKAVSYLKVPENTLDYMVTPANVDLPDA